MFTVREVSVVLVSQSPIEPQSLRPDVLRNTGIVPPEWVIANNISTPVIAQLSYQNGFAIQAEGTRYIFKEPIGGELRHTYTIHSLATRYLEASKLVPYNAMGINWLLDVDVPNPNAWITQHLTGESKLRGFSPISLQLVQQFDIAVCNLIFKIGTRGIAIDCNYHFQLSDTPTDDALAILQKWDRYQAHMDSAVSQL